MSLKISFKELYFYTINGLSTRDISDLTGISKSTIQYQQKRFGINVLAKCKSNPNFTFDKINTPEKAYALGFILADSNISIKKDVEVSVALRDGFIVDFISSVINSNVTTDKTFDKKKRIFPRKRTHKRIKDISKFTGGLNKNERHYPRVKKELERFLLLGFFDGDGCVTWGVRKDRNRIWQKISFTSSFSILYGVQQHLFNLGITSIIKPKSGENCGVLEFANKKDVITFINYIYPNDDFIILDRKYLKANALRLELEDNGEGSY